MRGRRESHQSRGTRGISALSAALLVAAPILACVTALLRTLHQPMTAMASAWGNTDLYESGEVPGSTQSCFQSPTWGTLSPAPCVTQRFGCTVGNHE